jgi:peptidoglycan/LPS O-acetylase OafA/YrhL
MNVRAVRFPLVDALRAIAALAVLGTHVAFFGGAYEGHTALGPYAQRLDVGVTVFFLISGFLLYRPFLLARVDGGPTPAAGAYAWRRFLRIVPAYWLALTVTVLALGTPGVFTADGVPAYYGLAQTYRTATIGGGLTQAWTLSIEVAFYAFLPVYAALQRRLPGRALRTELMGLGALVAVSEAWKAAVLASGDPAKVHIDPALLALPAYFDHFALGMGLALLTVWIERRGRAPRWVGALDRAPLAAWGLAAVAFWAVSTRIGLGDRVFGPMSNGQYLERHALYAAVALGLMLPAVVGDPARGAPRRILASRVLAWLGLVSYGIYLWHPTVLDLMSRWGFGDVHVVHPYVTWAVGGVAASAAVAAVSYYGLERPLLSLKRLVGRRERVPAGEALVEPGDEARQLGPPAPGGAGHADATAGVAHPAG